MIDDDPRRALRAAQEEREGALVFTRLKELAETKLPGRFDAAHLQAVHAYLFQDLPEHRPGVIREEAGGWIKIRPLEAKPGVYEVRYLEEGVGARITAVLDNFGGPAALAGLSVDEAAMKLAQLYGDLDYAHGFYEGNSRTLREFTRLLAGAAGFRLDWTGSNVSPDQRNTLYAARDLEVFVRHYSGTTAASAKNREEYEAALQAESFRKSLGDHPLRDIIRAGLRPDPE